MFRAISRSLLLVILVGLGSAPSLLAHPGEVIHKFPAPGRFCTGMTFDGAALWVADHKEDKLFRLDPESGEVEHAIPSPGYWPMGLAWDGTHLWNADLAQHKIFAIDPQDGSIQKTIDAPTEDPDGLTFDGTTLWVSDCKAKVIMKIDLSDGTAIKTITAPARSPNGLAFDGRYLWSSDRLTNEIYMIDPESGEVFIVIGTPGPYSHGVAWDGEFLWTVDYQTDTIYKLVRCDDELYRLGKPRRARITLTHEVRIHGEGRLQDLEVYLAVPVDRPQQKILSQTFAPADITFEKDRWNQEIAVFRYQDAAAGSTIRSVMEVEAKISSIHYFIFPELCGTLDDIPQKIRVPYTSNESKYLIDDPFIQKLAHDIIGDEQNPYLITRKFMEYLREHLTYELAGGWNVAPVVLERGTGSCSEYTFCFIALCRAVGLPARYVGSIVVRGDDASIDFVYHRWAQVFLPHYGWISVDPQGGDKSLPRERALSASLLPNRFLITTQGGGDSDFLSWQYNYNEAYRTDPQVQVNIETFAEWEPLKDA